MFTLLSTPKAHSPVPPIVGEEIAFVAGHMSVLQRIEHGATKVDKPFGFAVDLFTKYFAEFGSPTCRIAVLIDD